MKQAQKEILVHAAKLIAEDCERDVAAMEGKPFTGPVVAVRLGEMTAQIFTLAKAVEVLALAAVVED